jgi:hypothetical protein
LFAERLVDWLCNWLCQELRAWASSRVFEWVIVVLQGAALGRDSRPRPGTNLNNFAREV